jgi:hypothetical protein
MNEFDEIAEIAGTDRFTAEIEDGKFIITPSDMGIALLGYVKMAEEQIKKSEEELEVASLEYQKQLDKNNDILNFLDNFYLELKEEGLHDKAKKLINFIYPLNITLETGEEIEVKDWIEE